MSAWLVIAGGNRDAYAGNDGYEDERTSYYSWGSTVLRHAEPMVGDRIAIRDKETLFGHSVIERIDRTEALKSWYKCPNCG